MATVTRRFDSITALIEYASRAVPANSGRFAPTGTKQRQEGDWGNTDGLRRDWYGMSRSTQEAPNAYVKRMIAEGWPEGVKRIQEAITTITEIEPPESMRRRLSWGDHGDSIDMNRVYTGQLDTAWRRAKRQSSKAPAPVTIWMPFSIVCSANTEQIFWRGAAVAALADLLQGAGYSVAIMAYDNATGCTEGTEPRLDMVTTIKQHGYPMDIATLVAATALPATVRGVMYGAEIIAMAEDGYRPTPGICHIKQKEYAGMEPNDFSLPHKCDTATAAAAWVSEQITALHERQHRAA